MPITSVVFLLSHQFASAKTETSPAHHGPGDHHLCNEKCSDCGAIAGKSCAACFSIVHSFIECTSVTIAAKAIHTSKEDVDPKDEIATAQQSVNTAVDLIPYQSCEATDQEGAHDSE